MISTRETCLQYVRRRLSEGWEVKSYHYPFITIAFEGVVKHVDLRHDTLTIRPNANGDVIECSDSGPDNYQCCDDTGSGDGDSTYVQAAFHGDWHEDLYNLQDHSSESGTITKVTTYARCRRIDNGASSGQYRTALKSGSTTVYGSQGGSTSYTLVSTEYANNPDDSSAWSWTDIDNLQAGCSLYYYEGNKASSHGRCTQVYVEVDYTAVTAPTVTTQSASSVDTDSATLNGNVTDDGSDTIDERGFVWGKTSYGDPGDTAPGSTSYSNNWTEDGAGNYGTGSFTHGTGDTLDSGTTYYYRACAHNSAGWSYGGEESFTTETAFIPRVIIC